MTESCAVFIQTGRATLEVAAKSLEGYGLTVERVKERLVVSRPGSPSYVIRLVNEPHVIQKAAEIGAGTEHEAEMAVCGERFEIEIEDLAEALDEINTLIEVQGALQDCSGGYLFVPWNGSLSKAW
ncbi:hypothetical protein FHT03_001158 [Xanthomonas arboricola]|uniref:hypothetical protein n=1 Tax=Xanthomonas cannabis TaxID=1885674 RepID=UPI00160DEAFE|nr:hypothetical protein [Xanthomonas cannabis]MBB3807804.1 hypothetical protein [Xanthomonas cannabis]